MRERVFMAFFADAQAARRAARQLRQAGFARARVTLDHPRPGGPEAVLSGGFDPGVTLEAALETGAPAPPWGGAGVHAWVTLVTTEDLAPAALRLLREAGGEWR